MLTKYLMQNLLIGLVGSIMETHEKKKKTDDFMSPPKHSLSLSLLKSLGLAILW